MRRLVLLAALGALTISAPAQGMIILAQTFDDIDALPGWVMQNNSFLPGLTGWFQGVPEVFPAPAGDPESYVAANFNNTLGGTISNWLMTPEVTLRNGSVASFFTRTVEDSSYPDRLEVRMSTAGASTDAGWLPNCVGDFTTLLLSINPTLAAGGYPEAWTRYDLTISGLAAPVSGRLAFRYFVTCAGYYAPNSNYIGIDTFTLNDAGSPVPEPASLVLVGLGAAAIFGRRLRKRA